MQQRVYEHIKSPTKVSKERYQHLFGNGLLAPKYQTLGTSKRGREERDNKLTSKMVEVHAVRIMGKQKSETLTDQLVYTVMSKTQPGCVAIQYQSRAASREHHFIYNHQ